MVKKNTILANTSPVPGQLIMYPTRRSDRKHGIELAESLPLFENLPFHCEPQMIGAVYVNGDATPVVAYLYDDHLIVICELLNDGENLVVGEILGHIRPRNVDEQISAESSRMSLFGDLIIKDRPTFLNGFLCDGLESHMTDLGFSEATIANHHQHQMDSKGISFNPCAIHPVSVKSNERAA